MRASNGTRSMILAFGAGTRTMTQRYYNPFAGINLVYPEDQREHYDKFCHRGNQPPTDRKPFPRMVDMWMAGLSVAVHKGLKPADLSSRKTSNMTPGSIFDSPSDNWRIQAIMLVAIAEVGEVEIVDNPNRMMRIANGLAASGAPRLVEMLEEGGQDPIWNLSEAFYKALGE